MGEPLMTRCAGNLIRGELNRKGALPRAVRESRDYGSAVRVRILALQWRVATIEIADSIPLFRTTQV